MWESPPRGGGGGEACTLINYSSSVDQFALRSGFSARMTSASLFSRSPPSQRWRSLTSRRPSSGTAPCRPCRSTRRAAGPSPAWARCPAAPRLPLKSWWRSRQRWSRKCSANSRSGTSHGYNELPVKNAFAPKTDQFQISLATSPEYSFTQYEELGFSSLTQMNDDYATNSHYTSLLHFSSTLSLPRVVNFKFLLQSHQKYYITQYEEYGFS